jgi:hypothetical protein
MFFNTPNVQPAPYRSKFEMRKQRRDSETVPVYESTCAPAPYRRKEEMRSEEENAGTADLAGTSDQGTIDHGS